MVLESLLILMTRSFAELAQQQSGATQTLVNARNAAMENGKSRGQNLAERNSDGSWSDYICTVG
jgi:hypothetical protein